MIAVGSALTVDPEDRLSSDGLGDDEDKPKMSSYDTEARDLELEEGFCPYGNRCNFIHPVVEVNRPQLRHIDPSFIEVRNAI